VTLDTTVHLSELIVIVGAGIAMFKGGLGLRDAVRDMTGAVSRLDKSCSDHEDRIRYLEFGDRRTGERERRHLEG
jgi:hypothetical protein